MTYYNDRAFEEAERRWQTPPESDENVDKFYEELEELKDKVERLCSNISSLVNIAEGRFNVSQAQDKVDELSDLICEWLMDHPEDPKGY